jgi:ABC-type antimicrobial peptide transport system permease subunit
MAMIAALGSVVAAILILLLVQGTVEEQRTELATLRAIGAGTSVGWALILRAGALALCGVAAGGAGAWGLVQLLDRVLPTVTLAPRPADVLGAAGAFVLVAVTAALIPVARLRRMDPLEAFRQ